MNLPAQMTIGCNYRFITANNEQLAELITKVLKGGQAMYRTILDGLNKGEEAVAKLVIQSLNKYSAEKLRLWGFDVKETHNLVPLVLRNELASLISGTTITPSLMANYFALGTSSVAPSNSDVQLGTESLRAQFTNRSASANIAYLDVFFGTALVGGNSYNEAGIFVDGTGSANSGYLLSHTAQSLVLGASQTLTVNSSITIS